MFTVSDILTDINRGCTANNLNEDQFRYRIIFFVNEESKGTKHYVDTTYDSLRESLENIIRNNLTLTNGIVIANTTILKDGKCISLQSRSYSFSLDAYFKQINGECVDIGCSACNFCMSVRPYFVLKDSVMVELDGHVGIEA